MKRTFLSFVLSFVVVLVAAAAAEAQLVPVGGEVVVNTTLAGEQYSPDVAMDAAGNFVVVWFGGVGFEQDVFARRFAASGAPLGNEFQVNTFTSDDQDDARVAMDADGDFVVVWTSVSQFPEGLFASVGRLYDKTGAPAGGEFQIMPGLVASVTDVAMAANGDFMVVGLAQQPPGGFFVPFDAYAQLYDSAGTPRTSPFLLNTLPFPFFPPFFFFAVPPAVTATPDGGWAVALGEVLSDSLVTTALRFDAGGNPVGSEVTISDAGNGGFDASIAASSDRIVVSWEASGDRIRARLSDGGLVPLTGDFQVSTGSGVDNERPAVAMDGAGNFVVSWTERAGAAPSADGSDSAILARAFDPNGNPAGAQFVVNTMAAGFQGDPALAMSPGGRVTVVWYGNPASPSFSNTLDIFLQRFGTPATALADLIDFVASLDLGGVGNALIAKLEAASGSLAAGDTNTAINQLNAFQNQVSAQSGNKISPADAAAMLEAADRVIASLGG